jgi:hypothetical protein
MSPLIRPARTAAMSPAIALPLYTGSRISASVRAASRIATRHSSVITAYASHV